jgi:hypothetical protein
MSTVRARRAAREIDPQSTLRQMGSRSPFSYFDEPMQNRQRLLWTIATRRQLERWEPFVAAEVLSGFDGRELDSADIWTAATEHHFALVAGGNLLRALNLPPAMKVAADPTLLSELKEGRDLLEHWDDNMPFFNVLPRVDEPRFSTGKRFAERNPRAGPYEWLDWSNTTGARLLPNVSAPAMHRLLDAVEDHVLAADADLSRFVPPRAPSPWVHEDGQWWPKRSEVDPDC